METKGTEEVNDQGAIETKVETVDVQLPPGENKEPRMNNVGVVHLTRDSGNKGVVAAAADAVSRAFNSAKDAVFGSGHGGNNK